MTDYGNDERIEALWAIKAMEHAEVYFNVRKIKQIHTCTRYAYM